MSFKTNTTWVLLGAALVASLWASEARAAKGSFEQTVAVDEAILLDVSTGSGSIDVRTGPAGKVEIVGHIKVGTALFRRSSESAAELVEQIQANPPVELVDGRLRVGYLKGRAFKRNVSISYEIVVPEDTSVHANSGSGSVKLSDIGGGAVADTGSGSIRAEGIAGAFEGDTGSGSIYLYQSAPGDVEVSTGSGGIELLNIDGALHARAGSGRVQVTGRQAGTWDIDTGSGSVKIDLPDDAAFELNAESGSGGINIDHPVTVRGKISKRKLRGEVRGGGDLLKIDTGSGSIRVN